MTTPLKTSDFDYRLPPEMIAQYPTKERDGSRLLVYARKTKNIEHKIFKDIIDYLNPGDLLVLNDTKVIPARLIGQKETGLVPNNAEGAKIKVLLLSQTTDGSWETLVKPGKRLKEGTKIIFAKGRLTAETVAKTEYGSYILKFSSHGNFDKTLKEIGEVPLPPYIKSQIPNSKFHLCRCRQTNPKSQLTKRYQTIYAKVPGASAAPTAGLHFTQNLLEKIEAKGINISHITLHTGLGTFQPVKEESVQDHKIHSESYSIPKETKDLISQTKKTGKRVIAVGTTVVRALESLVADENSTSNTLCQTNLFIYPGYKFKIIDALITNFHWPKSTLIMLVSAFVGKDNVLRVYEEAKKKKYRFYSFGDAMFIR